MHRTMYLFILLLIFVPDVLGEKVLPVIISLRNGGLRNDVLVSAEKLRIPILRFKVYL